MNKILDPQPSTSYKSSSDSEHSVTYYDTDRSQSQESEDESFPPSIYKKIKSHKKKDLDPEIVFNETDVPELYSAHTHISAPINKNSKFSINISDKVVSLLKGVQQSNLSPEKFDIDTEDKQFDEILSHVNNSHSVSKIPEDCFRISSSSRSAIQAAYRTISKHQIIIKSNLFNLETIKDKFYTDNKSEAQNLIKAFITPIDIQISLLHDSIRKLRAVAVPRFIPNHIRRNLISAPIIPHQIWNISPQLINKINQSRTEYQRKSNYKTTHIPRTTRPFQYRGRPNDRRSRPQRKNSGFNGKRTNENRSDKNSQERN